MIRFEADSIKLTESSIFIPGRVEHGSIRVGSVFTGVDTLSGISPMQLRVTGIVAYQHLLEELPQGMTGTLELTGEEIERLVKLPCPFKLTGEK